MAGQLPSGSGWGERMPHFLRIEDVGGVGQHAGHEGRVPAAVHVVVPDHHELVWVAPAT